MALTQNLLISNLPWIKFTFLSTFILMSFEHVAASTWFKIHDFKVYFYSFKSSTCLQIKDASFDQYTFLILVI